jgi:general secretion pathway protein C
MIGHYGFKPIQSIVSGGDATTLSPETPLSQNKTLGLPHAALEKTSKSEADLGAAKKLGHLKLVGTAVNADNAPRAVIDNQKTHSQGLYKTGDEIDEATIVQIQRDSVIFDLNGKNFKLTLEKAASPEAQLKTDALLKETPNPLIYTTQDDGEKAWDQIQDLMTKIEFEPHFENGEPKGVSIERVSPNDIFEKIGFKSGDILVKVDDMEMTIADDAMEVYNCIRTKPAVQFTIIRKGEPEPILLEYHSGMEQN